VKTVAVCGALAQRPWRPGHAWVFLQYLLGFRQLGYEVLFIDRLELGPVSGRRVHDTPQARWLIATMKEAGLDGRYAALLADGQTLGLSRRRLYSELGGCELLLNVNGYLEDEQLLEAAPRRVYLDIDPGFAQIWEAQGLADTFAGHDDFVTVGTNVGGADCRVPTGGRRWITTLPPVVLDRWPLAPAGRAFTSVGSWRGPFAPLAYQGETFGLRAHEFRRFLGLPARVGAPCEVALDIEAADRRDREALVASAWTLVDPLRDLGTFGAYERYVHGSMAEIAIAKSLYVRTRAGWFSDRSASYLACGKPVLALDTGFGRALPTGRGLLSFDDVGEAAQAAEEVRGNLAEHSAAARELAEEHLDARVVLGRLLEELGAR
jgi:glycosyltransferase involved in cell wall biosynthesis